MAFRITRYIFHFLSVLLAAIICRDFCLGVAGEKLTELFYVNGLFKNKVDSHSFFSKIIAFFNPPNENRRTSVGERFDSCLAMPELVGDCVNPLVQIRQQQIAQLVQKDSQARIDQLALLAQQDLLSRKEQLAQRVQRNLQRQQERLVKEDIRFRHEQLNQLMQQDLQLQKERLAQLMEQDLLVRQKQLAQLVEQDLRTQQKQLEDLVQQIQRERLARPAKEDLHAWLGQQAQLVQQDLRIQQERLTQLARQVLEVQQEQLAALAQQTLNAQQEQLAQLIQQALQIEKEQPALSSQNLSDQRILEIKWNSHLEQKFPNPFAWQIRFFDSYFQKADLSVSLINFDFFSDLGRNYDLKLEVVEEQNKLLDVPKIEKEIIKETKFVPSKDSVESSSFPWLKRLSISYLAGDPSWLNLNNYTSLGMLFASEPKASMAMVDFRGHCFNERIFASNLGIIGRTVSLESKEVSILGFSLYWDFREAYWINFNQLGFGFELLKSHWDLRGNLYYPVGSKLKKHKEDVFYPGGFFWIQRETERTFSPSGNMEIGGFLCHHPSFSFYVAAGPYCFLGRSKPIWGGEVRIQPQIMDCFSVNLRSNYDSFFRWTFQGEATLSFPLYQLKKKSPERCLKDRRIYQRVERCDIIPIRRTFHLLNNF